MLTVEKLKGMSPGHIIARGTIENSPKGVYMTEFRFGDTLLWVALRGSIHDWAIYLDWEETGLAATLSNGQKLTNTDSIKKLVPCDKGALMMYRK